MITLPHTGMVVPPTNVHVTSSHETGDDCDGVRVATVHEERKLLGYAVTAYGRETRFVPASKRGAYVMGSFLIQTTIYTPAEVTSVDVLDHLVAEHDWARVAGEAERQRCYLLRVIDADGFPQEAELVDLAAPYPDYGAAKRALRTHTLPPGTARAELWTGQRWEQVYPHTDKT